MSVVALKPGFTPMTWYRHVTWWNLRVWPQRDRRCLNTVIGVDSWQGRQLRCFLHHLSEPVQSQRFIVIPNLLLQLDDFLWLHHGSLKRTLACCHLSGTESSVLLIRVGLRVHGDTRKVLCGTRHFEEDPKDYLHGKHLMSLTWQGLRLELQVCAACFVFSLVELYLASKKLVWRLQVGSFRDWNASVKWRVVKEPFNSISQTKERWSWV